MLIHKFTSSSSATYLCACSHTSGDCSCTSIILCVPVPDCSCTSIILCVLVSCLYYNSPACLPPLTKLYCGESWSQSLVTTVIRRRSERSLCKLRGGEHMEDIFTWPWPWTYRTLNYCKKHDKVSCFPLNIQNEWNVICISLGVLWEQVAEHMDDTVTWPWPRATLTQWAAFLLVYSQWRLAFLLLYCVDFLWNNHWMEVRCVN